MPRDRRNPAWLGVDKSDRVTTVPLQSGLRRRRGAHRDAGAAQDAITEDIALDEPCRVERIHGAALDGSLGVPIDELEGSRRAIPSKASATGQLPNDAGLGSAGFQAALPRRRSDCAGCSMVSSTLAHLMIHTSPLIRATRRCFTEW